MEDRRLDGAVTRAQRRLVPFLLLMYVLSFLDRANIGFAKEAFQASAGISAAAYALGAGLFFLTYAATELPSNLIMHKVGARIWMCRIMVSWGLISAATMFVRGEMSFYVVRLLLGAAEAGFFPGVILYLTYWFPARTRGRILGLFYFGAPLSFIVGGPLSGLLIEMHGYLGLEGWQWMFMIEGLMATAVGVWAYWYLDDKPSDAAWLPADESHVLTAAIDTEERAKARHGLSSLGVIFRLPRVWQFVVIYFLIQMSVYGVSFYLPAQVAALLGTRIGLEVGLVSAIPWLCALIATFFLPRFADRYGAHRWLAAATLAVSGFGIAVSAGAGPAIALVALSFAAAGFIAVQPMFWTFPTNYLGGVAAAGGIAVINALSALGGFTAPNIKNWADASLGAPAGLYTLAGTTLIGAVFILALRREPTAEPATELAASSSPTSA
ncbi:Major Facilitator Superfamily protein [Arboricoccus pini]|uniref:Major Facilitator Superfamily protein n=1 Tax=Arboricoccus pini TaxID=1963835 RepID=A0A212R1V5_9PROT|nr:MFS transporter [Arboricoccus pini]SNB65993.1 Major Facilitator Superfamily protein [Arboricoccus pini]